MARVKEVTKEENENYQPARERRRIEQLRCVHLYVDVMLGFLSQILTHVEKENKCGYRHFTLGSCLHKPQRPIR